MSGIDPDVGWLGTVHGIQKDAARMRYQRLPQRVYAVTTVPEYTSVRGNGPETQTLFFIHCGRSG
ncbi:unnamed protein product [Penicillium bialowiezense]